MKPADLYERILQDEAGAKMEAREPLGMYVTKDELRELWHYLGGQPEDAVDRFPLADIKIHDVPLRILPGDALT